jgi:PleD family two-component response regulator
MSLQLSPGITYYLRKLLRQNLDRFQFKPPHEGAIAADATNDLSEVLLRFYTLPEKVAQVMGELERLTIVHQALSSSAANNRQELQDTEETIFALFGFELRELESKGMVLVVDDVMANVNLLAAALRGQGYGVQTANNGAMALSIAQELIPDVILLDIMMPEMDGFAVCGQLQSQAALREVPVVFVSAVHDAESKVRAFSMGGADYVTKPFQIEEVLVRVAHQIKLRLLQKRIEAQNVRFQSEINEYRLTIDRYRDLLDQRSPTANASVV